MIAKVLRIREWGYSKLAALVGVLAWSLPIPATVHGAVWLVGGGLFALGVLALGYVANDLADRETDAIAGKRNASARNAGVAILVALSAGTIMAVGAMSMHAPVLPAVLVALGALVYSFPPRLKERPILGPIVGAGAQLTWPAGVALLSVSALPSAWAWACATVPYGLRLMIVHQLLDRENDLRSSTHTFVTRYGSAAGVRVIHALLVVEIGAIGTALLFSDPHALLAGGLAVAGAVAAVALRHRAGLPISLTDFRWVPLADLYSFWCPVAALALATARAPVWGLALLAFLAVFARPCRDQMISLWFTLLRDQREPA